MSCKALQNRMSILLPKVQKELKKYLDEELFAINTSSASSAPVAKLAEYVTLRSESSSELFISSHLFYLICFMSFLSSHVILKSYLFYLSFNRSNVSLHLTSLYYHFFNMSFLNLISVPHPSLNRLFSHLFFVVS